MRNIYDILASLGLEVPEDKKAELDKELAANYKTVVDYEKQTAKASSLQEQLTAAKEGLKAFEGVNVEDLKGQIAKLQTDLGAKDTEYQEKIAAMEFDTLLTGAITAAKGRSPKAIKALLDMDALKASKNQEADLKIALEGLQKESGYLFESQETPPPYAPGTGTAPTGGMTKEAFAKLGYRERVALKQANPTVYEQMKKE